MSEKVLSSKHRTLFENWWTIERNESVRHGLIWRIAGEAFEAGFKAAQQVETSAPPRSFQDRVFDWARDCFGERDTTDPTMRTFRFLEEALELAQACGCDRAAAERVLAYVYGRPPGVVAQEVGGTMVSLAVLCQALRLGMSRCAEDELARVLGKVEQIRARHAAKPDFSSPADETPAEPPVPELVWNSCGPGNGGLWDCPDSIDCAGYCSPPWTFTKATEAHRTRHREWLASRVKATAPHIEKQEPLT